MCEGEEKYIRIEWLNLKYREQLEYTDVDRRTVHDILEIMRRNYRGLWDVMQC